MAEAGSSGPRSQTVLVHPVVLAHPVVLLLRSRSQPDCWARRNLLNLQGYVSVPGQGSKGGDGTCVPSVSAHLEQAQDCSGQGLFCKS